MIKRSKNVWSNMRQNVALEMANSIEENKNKMQETWGLERKLSPIQKSYLAALEERIKDYREFAEEKPSTTK